MCYCYIAVFRKMASEFFRIYVAPYVGTGYGNVIFLAEFSLESRINNRAVGSAVGSPGSVETVYVVGPGGNLVDGGADIAYFIQIVEGVNGRKYTAACSGNGALSVYPASPAGIILAVCYRVGACGKPERSRKKAKNHTEHGK